MGKTLSVSAIKNGTVIDHIPSGQALTIVRLLMLLNKNHRVTLGLNLLSPSMGLKDLIKVEDRFLTEKEAHDIAVFAPNATLSSIKNYKVQNKIKVKLPTAVEKILLCPNPRCISRCEPIDSLFFVEELKNAIHLRCNYCEKNFVREEIREYQT